MSAGVLMLYLRHRFCGQIRNLPADTAPANYFFSGMLTHYPGLHVSQSADAGTSE
jgi:hypothetical protein